MKVKEDESDSDISEMDSMVLFLKYLMRPGVLLAGGDEASSFSLFLGEEELRSTVLALRTISFCSASERWRGPVGVLGGLGLSSGTDFKDAEPGLDSPLKGDV